MGVMCRGESDNPPKWLHCKKSLIPDMLARDPKEMPVWEICGAEFSKSDAHTADGISIRFPRIAKQRNDKTFKEATNLAELKCLYESSKSCSNLQMLTDVLYNDDASIEILTKIQKHADHPMVSNKRKLNQEGESLVEIVKSAEKKIKNVLPSPKKQELNLKIEIKKRKNEISEEAIKTNTTTLNKKKKLQYMFNDSSDEESDKQKDSNIYVATKKLSISADPIVMPKNIKHENIQKFIDNKDKMGPNDAVVSNTETKTITNKSSTNTINANNMCIAKNSDISIFAGVLLYVPNELRDNVIEELRYLVLWGGGVTTETKKCTHALHKHNFSMDSLSVSR